MVLAPLAISNNPIGQFIHNNVIDLRGYNGPGAGITVVNDAYPSAVDEIVNNTIIGAQWTAIYNYCSGLEFKNNICVGNGGSTGIYGNPGGDPTYQPWLFIDHSNNILYQMSPVYYGAQVAAIAGLTAGPDEYQVNPLLNSDYTLQAGSPAINAGTPVGLPFSGQFPDIGAFDNIYTGTPGTLATVSGTVTDTAGNHLAGVQVTGGANGGAVTNASGAYSFQTDEGSYTFTVHKAGYETIIQTVNVSSNPTTANFVLTSVVVTGTWYVGPNGNNLYSGTNPNEPWATMDNGDKNGILSSGETVIVEPGVYTNEVVLSSKSNGVTYKAQSGAQFKFGLIDTAYYSYGIYVGGASNVVLDGFYLEGCSWTMLIQACTNVEVRNFVVNGDQVWNNWVPAVAFYSNNGINFHNNAVVGEGVGNCLLTDGESGSDYFDNNVFVGGQRQILNLSYGTGPQVMNNIFYNLNTTIVGACAVYATSLSSNVNSDYNLFYMVPDGYEYGGSAQAGAHDVFDVDPMFVCPWLFDYRVLPGSPCIGAGVSVGLPYPGSHPSIGLNEIPPITSPGTVSGKVTNASSGAPIFGAVISVTVNGYATLARTDSTGSYSISVPAGTQSVTASMPAFGSKTSSVTVSAGNTTPANFALTLPTPKTYYVSTTGNDSNNGLSLANAWATIDNGDRQCLLNPGDTVLVEPGTYSYAATTNPWTCAALFQNCSGVAGSPITYQADSSSSGVPNISIGSYSEDGSNWYVESALLITNASYLKFNGFTVTGSFTSFLLYNTLGIEIENCVLQQTIYDVLYASNSTSTNFHNNLAPACPGEALWENLCDMPDIGGNNQYANNTIIDVPYGGQNGFRCYSYGTGQAYAPTQTATLVDNIFQGASLQAVFCNNGPTFVVTPSYEPVPTKMPRPTR